MRLVTRIAEMKSLREEVRMREGTVGFVPTMGHLHEGHLSLVRESVRNADFTAVSIFVNPAQFGPSEDFSEYPRDLQRDLKLLEKEKVDCVFHPSAKEIYPGGYKTYVEVHDLQDKLCGRSRPGHFRGVCTIVLKLFNIVNPDFAYFGQKDAQQAIILKRMVQDLDLNVKIEILPVVREKDGLAMSSRNTYLSPEERNTALVLHRSLLRAQSLIHEGERSSSLIKKAMEDILDQEPLARVEYVEVVDLESLDPLEVIEGESLVALAVFIGKTRLIDNIVVDIKE